MLTDSHRDISLKPRILIADDSRIVRATLIKHIEGMFEFREALDGEQAEEQPDHGKHDGRPHRISNRHGSGCPDNS